MVLIGENGFLVRLGAVLYFMVILGENGFLPVVE
jgi:hypothetical protein